jgi:hypothetical protein
MTAADFPQRDGVNLPPVAQLLAVLVADGAQTTYALNFPAPAQDDQAFAAPAKLVLGDGQEIDLGVIVAPTATTWRTSRQLLLVENVPVPANGEEAVLTWGVHTFLPHLVDGKAAVMAQNLPTATLFRAWPAPQRPMTLIVELEVDGLAAGQRVRLDAGGGNVRVWSPSAPANGNALTHRGEWTFEYVKPGPYHVVADVINADGYWVGQLAAQPVDIAPPSSDTPFVGEVAADAVSPLEVAAPLEIAVNAAALPPWLPYRYVRPLWASARTYTQAGGAVVARVLALGTYLAIRQEVLAGGQLWYQSTRLDWIPAASVAALTPSELRGVALSSAPDPDPDPDPGPDPDPEPDPTPRPQGEVTANVLNVRSAPGTNNPIVDQLRRGARVTILEERTVADAVWYRIGVNRWVHSAWIRRLDAPPPAPTPTRRGVVTADVLNVRARPGASSTNPPVDRLLRGAQVVIYEETLVGSVTWYRIGVNRWVHGGWIDLLPTPADEGAPVAAAAALPVGWVVTTSLNVRAEPSLTSAVVGAVYKNQSVSILETRTVAGRRWYRIGAEQWIYGANVRVAQLRARPANIRATERWVGVNLREQTLVAYEGDKPVYAALCATGLPRTPTVQGIFRTWLRLVSGKMSGGSAATGGYYYLEEVPWTLYFYSGYALHAAYWHDAFGNPRSHGCINLSPYDAWWIFRWSEPGGRNSPAVYVYTG